MHIVLIPAYEPDENLIRLAKALQQRGLSLLVVDDGSGSAYDAIFEALPNNTSLLRLPKNKGKGAALKAGMRALQQQFPQCTHFITADADGQHTPEDILRVAEALDAGASMVLTMRDFSGEVPLRSSVGNWLSRWIYTLLVGRFLRDNQSGLRGYAVEHIPWLLAVKGEKYDYEMNVLCCADKQHLPYRTLPIRSVYLEGNAASHFNPVSDTLRIYRSLFRSTAPSLCTMGLSILAMAAQTILFWYWGIAVSVGGIGIAAAGICVLWYYGLYRGIPYRDGGWMLLRAAVRYSFYTACCLAAKFWFPVIPPICVFLGAAVVFAFLRYFFLKGMAKRKGT